MSTPSPARYAGLDGLRAIAVGLVVLYHLFPPAVLPGGFIGVDVFFVISGFLITSLLLREHVQQRASLPGFWRRRARRLLPALAVMITVCASLGLLVGGDVLYRLGAQILGAATFTFNWWTIAADTGYFDASAPELFRNVWSLAVEEQFYLLWPLVLPLFFVLRRTWMLVAAAAALAAASALEMGLMLAGGADATRVYYGTDTHAFGLLLGAAAAFALAPMLSHADAKPARKRRPRRSAPAAAGTSLRFVDVPPRPPAPGELLDAAYVVLPAGWTIVLPPSARTAEPEREGPPVATRVATSLVGGIALAGLAALAFFPLGGAHTGYALSLLAASALSVALVVTAVWPGSPLGAALDAAPLRWIGERSYGIYLWHWPLLVLALFAAVGTGPEAGVPVWIGGAVLAATVLVAWASYRFIEQPVRTLGFRGAAGRFRELLRAPGRRRVRAASVAVASVLVVAGTTGAIAAAPDQTSVQQAVAAGEAALERAQRQAALEALADAEAAAARADEGAAAAGDGSVTSVDIPGSAVDAIGDSVMLAASGALIDGLPGIRIDAEVSRSMWAAPRLIEELADAGELRHIVVVALGTNGTVDPSALDRLVELVGPGRGLVLVNASAPRSWIPGVNETLRAFAAQHRNVVVADWASAIASHPAELASDRIHPGAAGGRRYADAVADAVDRVEQRRLEWGHDRLVKRLAEAEASGLPVPQ
ncbi:acyltransferase family protein [Microbacterium thalassium]|uniref:Peptidoglycan/LPS O-acetylase OafA/YrhL n=1 Tax=Microbacterium thalassium TaxID=362649 RepID=A0A7X0FQ21_9MICO|nr:acyltransferase family protein [Microbacterium thalassium]MBB6391042.1 peptidoglycan/LPS O-acetylase OafA/YrhL [Microbacterium thalassium]GLK24787.1 hypothetical protein GCM10017607_21050 [Microbacterium thalassium]